MPANGPCPSCGGQLVPLERSGVHIDACRQCRGVFLDRGELDQILQRERAYVAEHARRRRRRVLPRDERQQGLALAPEATASTSTPPRSCSRTTSRTSRRRTTTRRKRRASSTSCSIRADCRTTRCSRSACCARRPLRRSSPRPPRRRWRSRSGAPVPPRRCCSRSRSLRGELRRIGSPWLAVLAGAALAAHFGTFIPSLQYTSVASASALVCSQAVWAGLLGRLLGERLPRPGVGGDRDLPGRRAAGHRRRRGAVGAGARRRRARAGRRRVRRGLHRHRRVRPARYEHARLHAASVTARAGCCCWPRA